MEENSGAREFRIVDPPRVSPRTVWPNRPLLLMLTFFGSLAAGIALAFFLDHNSPVYFDKASLREALTLPTLGTISFVHTRQTRARRSRSAFAYGAAATVYSLVFGAAMLYFALGHLPRWPGAEAATAGTTVHLGSEHRAQ